jgi:hypothetical protein
VLHDGVDAAERLSVRTIRAFRHLSSFG